jgi:mRNA turnover protein 4
MTNLPMQELRNYWNDSKFVIGKNKVLQIALGKSEDTSYKTNSYLVSPVSISF